MIATGARPRILDGDTLTEEIDRRSVSGTLAAEIEISPFGSFTVPDGGGEVVVVVVVVVVPVAEAICVVRPDTALVDPALFFAVTLMRTAWPTSAVVSLYVAVVALAMVEQFAPFVSHRHHWNVYVIGEPPVHVPAVPDSVWPSFAVPVTTGLTVFTGAPTTTTAVAPEIAWPLPAAFVAVTVARSLWSTSALTTVYVCAVAPPIAAQAAPELLHRLHERV